MNEEHELAQTVDIPSSPSDSLDAGLAAGFGKRLDAPRSSLGDLRPVLLREAEGESSHVVKPNSDAMPQKTQSGDRYQLSGEIARGGMGAVLRGRDVDLGRDLAVKVLLEKYVDRPEVARRFIEEAQIGGQLQHPGIVPVYDIGRFGDRPFFTMKLVKGLTLAALLGERTDPAADRPRLLAIAMQVAQTLAYAHAKGVIHRDLKPANIMVGAFGEVQVMDWGLAKVLAEGGVADEERATRAQEQPTDVTTIRTARSAGTTGSFGTDTEAGSLLGTPAYMPPEQANGDVALLDRRADVFGIGAILCEILTGKPPYVGRSGEEVRRKAANGDLADAHASLDACGADTELIDLTRSCLAPEASDRPKDAKAVAEALTAYLDGVQERLHKAELAEAEARARAIEEAKRRRLTLALAGTVLAAMTLGGASWLWIKADREARLAQVTRDVNEALNKAVSLREQAKVATIGSAALFSQAREQTQRALALVQSGPAEMALVQQVASLQTELDEEQNDRQLIAALDEARLAQAEIATDGSRLASEKAVPLFRDAFQAYGLPVGIGDPEKAAEQIRRRPAAVRETILAALEDWGILIDDPTLGVKEPHREWMRAVLEAGEPENTWGRQMRTAITEKDLEKRRAVLENLRVSVDIRKVPAASLMRFAKQLTPVQKVEFLRQAQAHYPADFWINFDMGTSLIVGTPPEYTEGVRFLTAAIALKPDCSGAHSNLGTALRDKGKVDEAIACFRKAIELDPKFVKAHSNLGNALKDKGQMDEAIVEYRKAIELDPKYAPAHSNLGFALKDKGQVDEAIVECKKAIELDPNFFGAHNNLGIALMDKGRVDEAIACYRKAIELDPKAAMAHSNLGIALKDKGQVDGAIACFRKAIELDPKGAVQHFNLGVALKDKEQVDEAIVEVKKAIELDPKFAPAHSNLGFALKDKGQVDEAIVECKKAIELDPKFANAHTCLGNALMDKFQVDEAIVCYRKAIELDPKSAQNHFNLGVALRSKGKVEEAIECYRMAVQLDPKKDEAHNNLGTALMDKGELDEAIVECKKAIELGPKYAAAHHNLGNALLGKGQLDEAIECFKKAIALDPEINPPRIGLAVAQRRVDGRDKFPGYLNGSYVPATSGEQLVLAEWCQVKKFHQTATRLFSEAFAADPKLVDDHRYNASCDAALAAAGQGEDAANLDEQEQVRLRNQALDWLRAHLDAYAKQLEAASTPQVRTFVLKKVAHWQQDGDLASIRDEAALAALPVKEREAFTQLWVDVAALLQKASAPPSLDVLLTQLPDARKALPSDSPQLSGLLAQIGQGLMAQKKWTEAEPHLRECLAIREKTQPEEWTTFNTRSTLGGSLLGQQKYTEAEPLLLSGFEGLKAREATIPAQGKVRLPEALDRLIELYTATDKPDEVQKWQTEL